MQERTRDEMHSSGRAAAAGSQVGMATGGIAGRGSGVAQARIAGRMAGAAVDLATR